MNESKQIAIPETEPSFLATLERLATNPQVPVETIERLLAVQERVMNRRAEDYFNIAMSAAQSEMGPVSTDATNPQTHSKYATYGKLDKALRPIYTKHGFALSFGEADSPKQAHVRVVCYVTHRGGYTRMYHRDMPADGKGAKGGDVMTLTHAAGAAQSYAMRYLLRGIFNVAVGAEDADGNLQQRGPVITDAQVADLTALMDEVGIVGERRAKALKVWGVAKLEELLAKNYVAVVKSVEDKRK